mgnify:CR=1 FL=1
MAFMNNKKHILELESIYTEIKQAVKKRLNEFKSIRKRKDHKEHFIELAFCILTPQSSAKMAGKTIDLLLKDNSLFTEPFSTLAETLRFVRFKNNKARYLIEAREKHLSGKSQLMTMLFDKKVSLLEKRQWLVKHVKGIGYKEASHYLRNIGLGKKVAILDRHILKNMKFLHLIKEVPKTISPYTYLQLEETLAAFSEKIDIPLDYLDFVLWYKEAGEVYK